MKNIFAVMAIFLAQSAFGQVPIYTTGSLSLLGTNQFPGATIEGFETPINTGPELNALDWTANDNGDKGEIFIGTTSAYTLPSRVTLSSPVPNTSSGTAEILVYAAGEGYNFQSYGRLSTLSPPPGGSHCLLDYNGTATNKNSFTLTLPGAGALQVGLDLAGAGRNPGSDWDVITALDCSGNTLGNIFVLSTSNGNIGSGNWNFAGFTSSTGSSGATIPIKSITISYYSTSGSGIASHPAVDNLMFFQAPPTWSATGTTSWGDSTNWAGGAMPSTGSGAEFPSLCVSSEIIQLAGSHATGSINFCGSTNYTIDAIADQLVLDNSGSDSTVNASSGTQTIIAETTLRNNLKTTLSNNANLILSGNIDGSGSITLNGEGTLILSGSNTYTGGTFVDSGTLLVTNADALPDGSSLTVGNGGSLFLGVNIPICPYVPLCQSQAVPEPCSIALLMAGIATLIVCTLRAKRNACKP